ncbi:MAG: SGNH/GDSL hydrolase family protein [Lachnospiraceae bacterium]|nr:SGNH/GDSL hydrolase family protein [Lachnospiraceae bacterium]
MKRMRITVAGILAISLLLCGCGAMEAVEQDGTEDGKAVQAEDIQDENIVEAPRPVENVESKQEEIRVDEEASQEMAEEVLQTQETEQLAGATLSILGDSISTYQGYNPEGYHVFFPEYGAVKELGDTWWQIVTGDMDLEIYVYVSISGATVAGDSTGTEDPQCACNELRTNALAGPGGACPDRIIVYLGTNDLLETVRLGDNDGTDAVPAGEIDTFSDAYTLMLDKLQANYPSARIYCCTLLQVGDYGTQTPYVEFVNGAGLTAADYGEMIIRIAENRGLPVIDLYNCGVTIENLQEMTSDGVHPTAAGMRQIAAAVEEALAGEK